MEKTLVLLKPDAVERRLVGRIIAIYEEKGLNITALKMLKPTREIVEAHYQEHKEKPFFQSLVDYLTRGKVCALIIEGENAVKTVRKINGATDPAEAEAGTIRGQFALTKGENLVHASDSVDSAEREIAIWFPEITD
ncbi:MAG TPA: nucleoside-diphosphate kinase [Firmicutes bacterium]|uniref:Nucleoside diphosphate kinase n=1 Tax=Capillibacterium thermochitinicola TaxID=2699427 RepID=A0A8J6LHZ2_9FIRM|nr:nucleoside-diphosphate kinase [Capillibacterium thermochitinicola]MBA2132695.1 nucleoside-diphosphate kinase [Capillibacterium thermochitinicola]HHW12698.1 nucleoside-diphosphate kinase [Bacillota bacterium]